MGIIKKFKDKLYYYMAEKNWGVRREYGPYVNAHQEEHAKQPWKHWVLLLRLNWHYRIMRKSNLLLSAQNTITSESSRIYPVFTCSESAIYPRTPYHQLAKGMLDYDLISFDIFDTLILRALDQPKDVFTLVGDRLGCIGFYEIRSSAEKTARDRKFLAEGNREVTIYEIYQCVSEQTGIDIELGIATELAVEKELCFANPYMKRVFDILQSKGKRIVATSDMYIPAPIMKDLLSNCGYNGFDDIFISCEYKGNKMNGHLFHVLKQKYGKNIKIVHVGDNLKADIQRGSQAGIDTRYYKRCSELGTAYRERGMSHLIRSTYNGIIHTTLYNGTNQYTPAYEYGFIYGGIFILGYTRWIHQQAKRQGVDKVLFLARDGFIYKKVYDMMFNDIPSEYVYWSRIPSLKYGFMYSFDDFLNRMVDQKVTLNITIAAVLDIIGCSSLCKLLPNFGLDKDELVHTGNSAQIKKFFRANTNKIAEEASKSERFAKEYYSSLVQNSKSVALVDIGWRGDNQIMLKRLLQEKWGNPCEVHCYMAGSILGERNSVALAKEDINCYLFSSFYNRDNFDVFTRNIGANMAIFELFSQAPHPSFNGFGNDGSMKFNYAEVENYPIIQQILDGELDFCKRYISAFKNFDYLLNISGYDAFIPFRGLIRNYSFAKLAVGDLRFQQTVGTATDSEVKTICDTLSSYQL